MVAVSGASGFLGSHVVCLLLHKGMQVRAFRRSDSDLAEFEYIFANWSRSHSWDPKELKKKLQWVDADVLDIVSLEEALDGVDEVYHCAALVSFQRSDRDLLMKVNAEGTANMVNVCLQKGVKKFCHVSSVAALGRAKSGDHISEETRWTDSRNNSNYAVSKHKAEMEVWRGIEEGLPSVIVSPSVILGTGDWSKGSCRLFTMVWKGMPFYTTGVNGYVDVKDVAAIMVELMERNIMRERFIVMAENMRMKDYLDSVAEQMGKKKPFIPVGNVIALLARVGDGLMSFLKGRKPAITRETARSSRNRFYYDNTKIRERLGFNFRPLQQTIEENCRNFLQHQKTI